MCQVLMVSNLITTGGIWTNIVSRNNIYVGTSYALRNVNEECPVDFDYDNFFTTHPSRFIHWYPMDYSNLKSFAQATGQERHGFAVDPHFVDSGQGQLLPDSPLIDRGVRIPGVNDGFLGAAPDLGAFETSPAPFALAIAGIKGSYQTTWRVTPGSSWQLESRQLTACELDAHRQ